MRFALALMLLPVLPLVPANAPAFAQAAPQAGTQDKPCSTSSIRRSRNG